MDEILVSHLVNDIQRALKILSKSYRFDVDGSRVWITEKAPVSYTSEEAEDFIGNTYLLFFEE